MTFIETENANSDFRFNNTKQENVNMNHYVVRLNHGFGLISEFDVISQININSISYHMFTLLNSNSIHKSFSRMYNSLLKTIIHCICRSLITIES